MPSQIGGYAFEERQLSRSVSAEVRGGANLRRPESAYGLRAGADSWAGMQCRADSGSALSGGLAQPHPAHGTSEASSIPAITLASMKISRPA